MNNDFLYCHSVVSLQSGQLCDISYIMDINIESGYYTNSDDVVYVWMDLKDYYDRQGLLEVLFLTLYRSLDNRHRRHNYIAQMHQQMPYSRGPWS